MAGKQSSPKSKMTYVFFLSFLCPLAVVITLPGSSLARPHRHDTDADPFSHQ
jgi:hypothetical protein